MEISLEQYVEAARTGDLEALETLIRAVQQRVYGIALRMLGHPQDAEDAMQEILLKMVTHLASFRGECTFTTWAYRITVNHLLTMRKQRVGKRTQSFEELAQRIEAGLQTASRERRRRALICRCWCGRWSWSVRKACFCVWIASSG